MESIAISFGIFSSLLVNAHARNVPDIVTLAKVAEDSFSNTSINVCDETNTNNSYVYELYKQ